LALVPLAGCASAPRVVRQTDFELGTLFELERVTHEDNADEDCADVGGNWLVYDTDKDGQWEIYVKPIVGREVTRKTTTGALDSNPAISRDGKRIAFTSNREGAINIYVMDTERASSTLRVGEGMSPSFSPDGTMLFYQRYLPGDRTWTIWKFDFNTSQHSQLVSGIHPAASNSGNQLAYCKFNSSSNLSTLWILDLKSGNESQVASFDGASTVMPKWSPDDKHLLFTINRGNVGRARPKEKTAAFINADLAIVNADGTGQTNLTDNPANDLGRCWGADGFIYFSSLREKSTDIWRFKPRLVGT